jgi:hypothetical protein
MVPQVARDQGRVPPTVATDTETETVNGIVEMTETGSEIMGDIAMETAVDKVRGIARGDDHHHLVRRTRVARPPHLAAQATNPRLKSFHSTRNRPALLHSDRSLIAVIHWM